MFGKVLGRAALANYAPIIARQMRDFVGGMRAEGAFTPGLDCKQFCLRSLFELFIGTVPPEDIMNQMYDYNAGLLSVGKGTKEFKNGKVGRCRLTPVETGLNALSCRLIMMNRFQTLLQI